MARIQVATLRGTAWLELSPAEVTRALWRADATSVPRVQVTGIDQHGHRTDGFVDVATLRPYVMTDSARITLAVEEIAEAAERMSRLLPRAVQQHGNTLATAQREAANAVLVGLKELALSVEMAGAAIRGGANELAHPDGGVGRM